MLSADVLISNNVPAHTSWLRKFVICDCWFEDLPIWPILQTWPNVTSVCIQIWKATWTVSNSLVTKNWSQLQKIAWVNKKETYI